MCDLCMICGENKATKTNSHIAPSFLMASFTSYNGLGKRDSEVMFTITNSKDSEYTEGVFLIRKSTNCSIKAN